MRRSDAVALGIVAYGIGALLLLVATLVLALTALAAVENTASSLEAASGPQLAARLDRVEGSLDTAEMAIRGFDTTLGATADSTREGQAMAGELAIALRSLAASLDVTILGTRPFADTGAQFAVVADRADAMAVDLQATAGSLDANRASLDLLADEIVGLRREIASLRTEIGAETGVADARPSGGMGATDAVAIARLVVVALLAWLAIPVIVVIASGRQRWRRDRP